MKICCVFKCLYLVCCLLHLENILGFERRVNPEYLAQIRDGNFLIYIIF